jgi:2-oxoglutarate dehydrogenase E2 component (dihydrolipoamide succinyltransferase)
MPIEVKAPEIGESVSEIFVGQWHIAEGERVELDEPLVELESDKATLDLPAPSAGVLTKILKQSGDATAPGEVIALIDEAVDAKPAKATERPADEVAKTAPVKVAGKMATDDETPSPGPPMVEDSHAGPSQSVALEKGGDAPRIPAVAAGGAETATESDIASPSSDGASRSSAIRSSGGTDRGEQRVPMSPLRRRIADRLVDAQRHAALLTTFNEVDMSAVKQLRAELGEQFERKHKIRLGFMSFFVKAAVDALRQCPELNAMVEGEQIVYRHYYDLGVAVSTDKGLVVPVLRNAERMSFAEIELAIDDLAARARDRTLRVEDLQGGTFTITNGGIFGSLLSTPIVNPPQSGVLGMHAIQSRPVADGEQVVIKPMMYLALTYDHRIVDGREAVTFLRRVKESIEWPARMLLDV